MLKELRLCIGAGDEWRRVDRNWLKRPVIATGRASIGDLGADSGWHPNRSGDYSMEVIECQLVTE
jgi:hypothetical protein